MNVTQKMLPAFRGLKGGLFSDVAKADVGTALNAYIEKGASLLCWADPFYPDHVVPEHVKRAVLDAVANGPAAHYTMPIGNAELKKAIAEKLKSQNGMDVNPERNILVTPGSDSGLLFAMMPFIGPGDEVLVPDPSYPNNFLDPALLGGVAIPVPLMEENRYQLDIGEFEKRLTSKTKVVLLTNPNNPTTTVLNRESLEALARFAVRHELILVADQAFEDFIFDRREFVSIASLPGMWERTLTVFSISKGMALSGYRVGYIVADDRVMDVLFGCAVNVIGATNTASQIGAIAAMRDRGFMERYREIFDRRRKMVYEIINTVPGVSMAMPESSFLSWVNVSRLGSADEVSAYIAAHANVVVNSGTAYGACGEGHIRIVHGCYKADDKLLDALFRLSAALAGLAVEKGVR